MEKITVVGLGYVGLPLAVEFGKYKPTIGFDINIERIENLLKGIDETKELTAKEIKLAHLLEFTFSLDDIKDSNHYIITIPTPIDNNNQPNLSPLKLTCEMISKVLKKNDVVIFESTVYPGCTEEVCVPILEQKSNLKYNIDFFCGYSPERINPGDQKHHLTQIKKITSGSTPEIANKVDKLYQQIIKAGTYKASNIKIAEAAKVIENSQRDLNIAFVNELALIFDKMDIDTHEVIEAAATKWNFMPFKPGLVGGHCIGIDPYYLTFKAENMGYHPNVILAGRKINDSMGVYIANKIIKLMCKKAKKIIGSKALIMGITFKEDCADIRNTGVVKIIKELKDFEVKIDIFDPIANKKELKKEYDINLIDQPNEIYDVIVLAVSHSIFKDYDLTPLTNSNTVVYDVKGMLDKRIITDRL